MADGARTVVETTNTYDLYGDVLTRTDAVLGHTTTATYNSFGQLTSITDPNNIVRKLGYNDTTGHLTSDCTPLATVSLPASSPISCDGQDAAHKSLTTWSYTDNSHPGDVKVMVDPAQQIAGGSTTYNYADGQVQVTDANSHTTTYCVDAVGRPTSTISPRGAATCTGTSAFRTSYLTNGFGEITKVTPPVGNPTSRIYDAEHHVTSETGADGFVTAYSYWDNGLLHTTTQAQGNPKQAVSTVTWNANGTRLTDQDPAGNVTTYGYDASNRLKSVADPSGTRVYAYDNFSRVVTRQDPGTSSTCAGTKVECVTFGYISDSAELNSIAYSDGVTAGVSASSYDAVGHLTGRTSSANPSATSTSQAWNSLGQMTSSTVGSATTGYAYDLAGKITSITYPNSGGSVQRGYDLAGNWTSTTDQNSVVTKFGYDESNDVVSTAFKVSGSTSVNQDQYGYDNDNAMTSATYKKGGTQLTSLVFGRDLAERLNGETLDSGMPGATTTYDYTPLGQLEKVNGTVTFAYNAQKDLIKLGSTMQGFDAKHQLCWTASSGSGLCTDTPAGRTTYSYDTRGNRTGSVPATGTASTFGFDQANRMTSAKEPALFGASGQYHPVTPARVVNTMSTVGTCFLPNGASTPCTRLTASQPTLKMQITGQGGVPATGVDSVMVTVTAANTSGGGFLIAYPADQAAPQGVNLTYDAGVNVANAALVKLSPTGQIAVSKAVGDIDVIIDVVGWFSSPTGTNGGSLTAMNAQRLLDTRTPPTPTICSPTCARLQGGATTTVQVTGNVGVPASGVSAVVANFTVIPAVGADYLTAWPAGQTKPGTSNLNYTASHIEAALSTVQLSSDGKMNVALGTAGTSADLLIDIQGYYTTATGDAAGVFVPVTATRLVDSRTSIGCAPPTPTAPCTITVTGANGVPAQGVTAVSLNITATGSTNNFNWLVAYPTGGTIPNTSNLNFDAGKTITNSAIVAVGTNGQITLKPAGATNILVDINGYFTAATNTWTYGYDADSLRLSKTDPYGSATAFTWDKSTSIPLLLSEKTAAKTTRYIYGPLGPYEQIDGNGVTTFLHQDQLGSIRYLTDINGNTVGARTYNPYGTVNATSGTFATPFGYAGQYTDSETGYQYVRARYYDPATGQFPSRDPLALLTGEPNGYVHNSPLNATDPSGLFISGQCIIGEASAVVLDTGAGRAYMSCTASDGYGTATVTTVSENSGFLDVGVSDSKGGFYSNAQGVWELQNLDSCQSGSIGKLFVSLAGTYCTGPHGLKAFFLSGGIAYGFPGGFWASKGTTTIDYGDGGLCAVPARRAPSVGPPPTYKVNTPYTPDQTQGYSG